MTVVQALLLVGVNLLMLVILLWMVTRLISRTVETTAQGLATSFRTVLSPGEHEQPREVETIFEPPWETWDPAAETDATQET